MKLVKTLRKIFLKFILTYGKKWWFVAAFFLLLYMINIKFVYTSIDFNEKKLISFLFSVHYPIIDFKDFELPYLWIIFHLFSMLGISFSIVDLLEKQSTYLLIRVKSKRILSVSILISVLEASLSYVFLFHFFVAVVVYNHHALSLSLVKYFVLLWLTVMIINYLCLAVYLIFSNSILSFMFSLSVITVASIADFKYFPLKSSLILDGQFNQYLTVDSYSWAVLSNILVIIILICTIDFFMKRHTF